MKEVLINLVNNSTFLTVISGVLVFVFSQIIMEFVINPKKKYRALKERIAYTLTLYSCYYMNPYRFDKDENLRNQSEYDDASKEVRKIGSELSGYIGNISKIRVKKRKRLLEARDCIIGISNGFYQYPEYSPIKDNRDAEKRIKELLKIK